MLSRCVLCLGESGRDDLCSGCHFDLPSRAVHEVNIRAINFQIFAAFDYLFPLNILLSNFKYGSNAGLGSLLARLMLEHLPSPGLLPGDLLCPIPVHRRRLFQRGFNQTEVLASLLGQALGFSCLNLLIRQGHQAAQAGLPRHQRLNNLRHAFRFNPDFDIRGKRVILIDDVVTTGSTLKEAGSVLRRAGAREVAGWVCAAA